MVAIAAGEDEVGASFGQGTGQILAEAAAGAGHNSYAAGKIEELVLHGNEITKQFRE